MLSGYDFGDVVHSDFDAGFAELPEFLKGKDVGFEGVALLQRVRDFI